MERYTLDTPPDSSTAPVLHPSVPPPSPTLHSVLTHLHKALIQHYSQTNKSLPPLISTTKSALRDLKAAFPGVWEDYKRTGKPATLVQTLRADTLSKSLLKGLILEVGVVLKCYVRAEGEAEKGERRGKRPWSIGELAELGGDIEKVDRPTKRMLRDRVRDACRRLFSKD